MKYVSLEDMEDILHQGMGTEELTIERFYEEAEWIEVRRAQGARLSTLISRAGTLFELSFGERLMFGQAIRLYLCGNREGMTGIFGGLGI